MNMKQVVLSKDYRDKVVYFDATGILREETVKTQENIARCFLNYKNKGYNLLVNIDCRHKRYVFYFDDTGNKVFGFDIIK